MGWFCKNDLFRGFISGTNVLKRYHVNEGLIVAVVGIEKKMQFDKSKLKVSWKLKMFSGGIDKGQYHEKDFWSIPVLSIEQKFWSRYDVISNRQVYDIIYKSFRIAILLKNYCSAYFMSLEL